MKFRARLTPAFALGMAIAALPGCVERLIYEELKGEGADAGEFECVAEQECADDEVCFEGVCVGTGSLRFSLSWEVETDFDLHVTTPAGDHLHFAVPMTDYAHLDVDDCVSDDCADPDAVHVENVFFDDNAPRGEYTVWVQNFSGSHEGPYKIDVVGEVNAQFSGTVPAIERGEGERHAIAWE